MSSGEKTVTATSPEEFVKAVTPHEHDAAGCLDCDCAAAPWSSRTPCTCVRPENPLIEPIAEVLSEWFYAALGTQIDHIIRAEAHAEEKKSESRLAEEAVRKSVTEGKRLHAGLVALIPGTEPDYDKYVREFKRANHR